MIHEISVNNPHSFRRIFCTTVVKDDLATLQAAHASHVEALNIIKKVRIKGLIWNLIMFPLPPANKSSSSLSDEKGGEPGPTGLSNSHKDPLVLILFCSNWEKIEDIRTQTRLAIERIGAAARKNGTDHPFRYINYCIDWQKPFESFGEGNPRFLKGVSRKYDEIGFFQDACAGPYKILSATDEKKAAC